MKVMRISPGEFRIVEGRSAGAGDFPVTAATPDSVGSIECVKTVCATVRAGSCRPDGLETLLDDGVERLGATLYCSQFHKIRKHPAEGGAFLMHMRPFFGGMYYCFRSLPPVYRRATTCHLYSVRRLEREAGDTSDDPRPWRRRRGRRGQDA